nr:FapA family protein [Sporosarcina sp. E16_8]
MRSKKNGFPLKSFDAITCEHPRLKIISFPVLKKALTELDAEHIIGNWIPAIEVAIATDKMIAQLYINVSTKEFEENKQSILKQAEKMLDDAGVIYGRTTLQDKPFKPGESIIAAVGKKPQKGEDAVVSYIEIPERRPMIREDGSADYFEMNFVTPIKQGDWLGEKALAQKGIDGKDVLGNDLAAQRGNDAKIYFDRKSVTDEQEADKVVLKASHGGALESIDGLISVGKQLIISGDVGPETGSIKFDGSVAVYGTVLAGFSVNATGDISIEGNEGITNAKEIQSSEGDVYIKGGVFGGGLTIVEAQGNIFIKHANNCKLYGKEVHVGLYLLGSEVSAESVFVDKNKGKIIGGEIDALYKIECAFAGNSHERKTILSAKGIDKELIYMEIQEMAKNLKERQEIIEKLEQHALPFRNSGSLLKGPQAEAYEKMLETIESNRDTIIELDKEIQLGLRKIKQAVPAQIEVTREAYPGTVIQIGSKLSILHSGAKGVFEIVDGVLNV